MKKRCFLFLLFTVCFILNLPAQDDHSTHETYICPPCGDGSCDKEIHNAPGVCTGCGMALIKAGSLKNVAIFLFGGVEILDFSGPGEVFAAASPYVNEGGFRVYTVAATKAPIVSQGFVKISRSTQFMTAPNPIYLSCLAEARKRPSTIWKL